MLLEKNIKWLFLISSLLLAFTCCKLNAQVRQPAGKLNINTSPGGIVGQIPLNEYHAEASSHYLINDWTKGEISANDGSSIEGYKIKYDIKNEVLELKNQDGIKTLKTFYINAFELFLPDGTKKLFVEGKTFDNKQSPTQAGFFEVLVDDRVKLLDKIILELIPAGYNQALDVGERTNKYSTKRQLYFCFDNELYPVAKSKKKLKEQLQKFQVDEYLKESKISLKNRLDMIKLTQHLNTKPD